jgi:hypothetical protein
VKRALKILLPLLALSLAICLPLLCCGAVFAASDPNARLLLNVFGNLVDPPPPGAPVLPTPAPLVFAGNGDDVVRFTIGRDGLVEVLAHHSGSGYFSLWLLDADGQKIDLLAHDIGPYDGRSVTNLPAGQYLIEITASGPWRLAIEAPR